MSHQPVLGNDNVHGSVQAVPAPEERFWRRYSPHHEFPLSGATSVAVHGLALAVILVGGFMLAKLDLVHDGNIPMGAVEVAPGSGGDAARFDNGGPGVQPPMHGLEDTPDRQREQPRAAPSDSPIQQPRAGLAPAPNPVDSDRLVQKNAAEAERSFGPVHIAIVKDLLEKTDRPGDRTGPGTNGSNGTKDRGGDRGGTGDKKGVLGTTPRELRWVLLFDTLNGDDYRKQLHDLGAILAVPNKDGTYRVIRDLTRVPAKGNVEDLKTIDRIFWVDDKPQSVASLSRALGIDPPPAHIVAFFPKKLEDKLLDMELKYQNREEKKIQETKFRIVNRGGTYDVEVIDQR